MSVPVLTAAQYCGDSLDECPIPLLQRLVVEAAREVCRDGRIWKLAIPPVTIQNNVSDYDLTATLPLNAVIDDIDIVRINGQPILPYAVDATSPATDQTPYMGGGVPGGFIDNCQFQNTTYTRPDAALLTLVPVPNSLGGSILTASLVLIPALGSSTVPDIAWDEYAEAIEQYVKWKAMTRPGKPYSDPIMGADHKLNWENWAAQLRAKGRFGNITPRMRTVPNDFG